MSVVAPRILHAAAEVFPLLKTGGLADVTAALPAEQQAQGLDVRIVLPGFPAIRQGMSRLEPVITLGPAFGAARITVERGRMPDSDVPAYVVDAPWLYDRSGSPYLDADGREWADNHWRFAAFGWVAAHLASGELDATWRADILHAHDWHAGLAPTYLRSNPACRLGSVFTVHNLAYQGRFPLEEFRELRLPASLINIEGLEFHGHGNFMKAGLVCADRLTTVSPRYAQEICTPEFGSGLDGVLTARRGQLDGILNGIDQRTWDPDTDACLPARYSVVSLAGKAACKARLQGDVGLERSPDAPLFTAVSRLTDQKGSDLILGVLPELLRQGGQLTVLGTGDRYLEQAFAAAAAAHPGRVAVQLRYDEAMAHRMIAAADVILVPSRFEPCGLTQMYGLRYGTLPLVRRVGGLADTVTNATADTIRDGDATGFVFDHSNVDDLTGALLRAVAAWRNRSTRERMIRTAMGRNHSWAGSAQAYRLIYDQVLAARPTAARLH